MKVDSTALRHRVNAGKVAIEKQVDFFGHQFASVDTEWKDDKSPVTFVDFAISERIIRELQISFQEDVFCSEESNPGDEWVDTSLGYSWILDPIDGTNNYAIGFPNCAISLALCHAGIPIYGYIYDFAGKQLIHGGKNFGLFIGKRRIEPQREKLAVGSVIGMQFPVREEFLQPLLPFLSKYRIRSIGTSAMIGAYTALGWLTGSIDFRVKVWDIAAAYALCEAAGCGFSFLGEPALPLSSFHPNLPACPYYAGSDEFCRMVEHLAPKLVSNL